MANTVHAQLATVEQRVDRDAHAVILGDGEAYLLGLAQFDTRHGESLCRICDLRYAVASPMTDAPHDIK